MAGHVILTELRGSDSEIMSGWINDRSQVLSNSPYRPVHERQHAGWFESIQLRTDTVIFAIRISDSGKLIGTCQLHGINPTHRHAELQIRLGDIGQRGRGYGSEAVRLLLEFAFRDLNLERVFLHVFIDNVAAIRVYEKNGFCHEGVLRRAAYIDGKYKDVLVMGILRNEFSSDISQTTGRME